MLLISGNEASLFNNVVRAYNNLPYITHGVIGRGTSKALRREEKRRGEKKRGKERRGRQSERQRQRDKRQERQRQRQREKRQERQRQRDRDRKTAIDKHIIIYYIRTQTERNRGIEVETPTERKKERGVPVFWAMILAAGCTRVPAPMVTFPSTTAPSQITADLSTFGCIWSPVTDMLGQES